MKLLSCIAVFAAFCGIGVYIWRGYKQRKIFFENLLAFCDHLLVEISFSKNTVLHVIENYSAGYAVPFQGVLSGYQTLAFQKQDITHERIAVFMWKRLKANERTVVIDFFYELGRHGSTEESQKIQNKKIIFDTYFKLAAESLKRDASIYLKIFILLGIGAVILLL